MTAASINGLRRGLMEGLRTVVRNIPPVPGRYRIARELSRMLVPAKKAELRHVGNRPMVFDFRNDHEASMYFDLFAAELSKEMFGLLRHGDTFVDVGANVGYFSCLGASLVEPRGKVYAIDANPFCANRIRESRSVGEYSCMEVVCAAVGQKVGEIEFHVADDPMYSSILDLNQLEFTSTRDRVVVPMITLDLLLKNEISSGAPIRLVKIDIEGAEVDALYGAADLLRSGIVQNIYIEVHNKQIELLGRSPEDVDRILASAGYRVKKRLGSFSFLYGLADRTS